MADLSEPHQVPIPARSEKQALDWSLVLASQSIDVALGRDPESGRWQLLVPPSDYDRARETLRQYLRENRTWSLRLALPGTPAIHLHWAALVWVFVLTLIHGAGGPVIPGVRFETKAVDAGEWWRGFTATWIHADLAHLSMNALLGGPLLALAMGRYGAGLALAGTLIAGAGANFLAAAIRQEPYIGLGASGVVMAAIGMLSMNLVGHLRAGWHATRWVAPTILAGAVLFLHLGTSPHGDVLVHALGFLLGIPAGLAAALCPDSQVTRLRAAGVAVAAAVIAIPWITWRWH